MVPGGLVASDTKTATNAVAPFLSPKRLPLYLHTADRDTSMPVEEAIRRQSWYPRVRLLPDSDPYAYGASLRYQWANGTGFINVEMHAPPAYGALDRLNNCEHDWCLHVHVCRGQSLTGALSLVKFSAALTRRYPDLVDKVLADPRTRRGFELGLLHGLRLADGWAGAGRIRSGCIDRRATERYGPWPGPLWPTTTPWWRCDAPIGRALMHKGVEPHYHQPAVAHVGTHAAIPVE